MYLAKIRVNKSLHYLIRQSYFDRKNKCYRYQEIYNLGENPKDAIHIFDERICYFVEELENALTDRTNEDPTILLENLLWDFLPREYRQRLSFHSGREKIHVRPLSESDREAIAREIHIFDRRRLYFLRYNGIDQSRLYRMHEKLCRPLLGQCRDEREYHFREQESILRPTEYKTYVYAIFDLQRHFQEYYSTFMPEALNQDKIADHLEKDICVLHRDKVFWKGMENSFSLNEHLRRYLFMFFDFNYARRSYIDDFARHFQDSHRTFSWPDKNTVSQEETSSIFGEDFEKLKRMKQDELTRLFRKKAKELHPDIGGEHENFILLCNAYNDLLGQLK